MTLREKQSLFALLVPSLIDKAFEFGFEVTLGESYRSPEEALRLSKLGKGIKNSVHTLKLAIDLNLFLNGQFVSTAEAHKPLGEWWEKQHPFCRWGGRFQDGNHYSFEHNGVK